MTPVKSAGRSLSLKNVPDDVFEFLIHQQTRIKLEKGTGKFGLDQVIYKILRAVTKLAHMPRREYSQENMVAFGRFIATRCVHPTEVSDISLRSLLEEWKKSSGEFEEDRTMVTLLGKTPGDILGLKGPKKQDPPSSN